MAESSPDELELSPGEKRLYRSERLQDLRERPVLGSELPKNLNSFSHNQRQFVERLKLTRVQGNAKRKGSRIETVYYLAGDERRAVRRFIEANEDLVAQELAERNNKFAAAWTEFMYRLLKDEWRFYIAGKE